jgi:hypothetical protein
MIKNIVLLESITHIEDLPPRDFIRELKSINQKIITEKLDGANLWFGVDDKGFFTSREGKNPKQKRFYEVSDYPVIANYNGFRAAHIAIEKAKKIILKYLQPGDMIEIEVVFGSQPNTVSYANEGTNYIIILRGISDTPEERVKKLSNVLSGQEVTVVSTVLSSIDGNTLQSNDESLKWKFETVRPITNIDVNKISEVESKIKELENFLDEKNEKLQDLTNDEVVNLSLNKIKQDRRDLAKDERERLKKYILEKFKLPIKKVILSRFVKNIKPMLGGSKNDSENIGIEGVVLRDPNSDDQIKIVDRDVFTSINFFNSTIRSHVAGTVKTTDQDAPIELRGGAFGQAKIRIANLLGLKDLALTSGLKKTINKFSANTASDTAKKIAESLNIQNFDSIKRKIEAVLDNSIKEINELLTTFKAEATEYTLKLKSGKEIKFSPEVMKRTLTAFAETKQDIASIIRDVKKSQTPHELVLALYGKSIEKILNNKGNDDVKEQHYTSFSLLKRISEEGEGATTAAAGATAAAPPSDSSQADSQPADMATKSGAIAPYPYRLLNGKVVIKRKKNFVPFKKFKRPGVNEGESSLLKIISEIEDVNTLDKTANSNDISFNNARNRLNGNNVNVLDITNYLNKAKEINDEVDTIAFGLELDDGKVVKVYVDAQQADNFEKALGDMLGKEDDIEEVLNSMAQTFSIVDVAWPETNEPESDDIGLNDKELDDEVNSDQNMNIIDDKSSEEIDTTINKPEEDDEATSNTDITASSDKYKNLKQLLNSEDEEENEEDEEAEDEEESEEETESKAKSTSYENLKKLIKKEEEFQMSRIKDNFELLLEAKKKQQKAKLSKEKEKDTMSTNDKSLDLQNLLKSFPAKQDKVIITLMVDLGAPAKNLVVYTHLLRNSIESASDRYLKNASFRMWVKKLISALEKAENVSESLSFDKRLQTKYQHMAYNILLEIGMPQAIEKIATKDLLEGIKKVSKMAVENNDVRLNLIAVAEELGVADELRSMTDVVKEQTEMPSEDLARMALIEFFEMFGIDTKKNISVERQLDKPMSKMYVTRLSKSRDGMQRFNVLKDRLKKLRMATESYEGPGDYSEIKSSDISIEDGEETVNWMVANLASSGMSLRSDNLSLKLDIDQVDILKNSFEYDEDAVITDKNGVEYSLTPDSDGGFTIVEVGDNDNGDTFTAKEVQRILDMM